MTVANVQTYLKMQVDDIITIYNEHQKGKDVALLMYWQMENLQQVLSAIESHTGAEAIREKYKKAGL